MRYAETSMTSAWHLASSWDPLKCISSIALAGHSATQLPQPLHFASSISASPLALITGTLYGQTLTQVRQAAHRSPSTTATTPPTSIFSLERMVQARETAALAWE